VLGIDKSRVLVTDEPTLFARAVFTTAVSHENIAGYPVVLDQLRQLVESRMGQDSSRYGPRLWLERRASLRDGGVVVNRDEVYRCLEPYRFDIVDLATLSFAEQLSTVRHATVIAGPHGSQFVHAQFMPPGSTILECFSPAYVNPSILQICRVLRHRYHQVVGRCNLVAPYTHGRDCEVDCEHLALVLDSLELGAGAARNAGQTS
jgi:capsular polysaccharide biosynthesis protein